MGVLEKMVDQMRQSPNNAGSWGSHSGGDSTVKTSFRRGLWWGERNADLLESQKKGKKALETPKKKNPPASWGFGANRRRQA